MILLELTKYTQNKYRKMFPEIKSIVDKLDKKDVERICGGTFKDSPYVVYRSIHYEGGDPAGFIDVYSFDDEDMNIVLAVLQDYRGRDIAKKMVRKMEREIDVKSIKYLTWKADIDNYTSRHLAENLGYELVEENKKIAIYKKPNPKYKKRGK